MGKVVIGVDPHKASNTLVVIDAREQVLAQRRFANDGAGYREMKTFVGDYRDRVWAVEGARGVGAGLAQRLVAEREQVLNVPAKLSARVRALGGGSGRKTDNADAFAVAVAGLRARDLQPVRPDDVIEILGMLTSRRQELVHARISTVNRLHDVLCHLIPGGATKNLRATRARQLLSTVRPRAAVGKARKQLALDYLAELVEQPGPRGRATGQGCLLRASGGKWSDGASGRGCHPTPAGTFSGSGAGPGAGAAGSGDGWTN